MSQLPDINVPGAPRFEGDTGHLRYAGCDNECLVCNRPVVEAKCMWVHVVGGGGQLAPLDTDPNRPEDQGWFPVGTACARRVPKGYKRRR